MEAEHDILTIQTTDRGWALAGEIDTSTAAQLRIAFSTTPPATTAAVEVDMSGVTFIDSSGLRCLVELAQRVQLAAGTVTLVDTPRNVSRLIELAELQHLLDVRSAPDT